MKALLSANAATLIDPGDLKDPEYRERLKAWSDDYLQADLAVWRALAEVLSAAIQLDLERPAWCHCSPDEVSLGDAIDTVLGALPPRAAAIFDKRQGT